MNTRSGFVALIARGPLTARHMAVGETPVRALQIVKPSHALHHFRPGQAHSRQLLHVLSPASPRLHFSDLVRPTTSAPNVTPAARSQTSPAAALVRSGVASYMYPLGEPRCWPERPR